MLVKITILVNVGWLENRGQGVLWDLFGGTNFSQKNAT